MAMSMQMRPEKQIGGEEEKKIADMVIKQNIRIGDAILITFREEKYEGGKAVTFLQRFDGIANREIQFNEMWFPLSGVSSIQKISPGDPVSLKEVYVMNGVSIEDTQANVTGKFVSFGNVIGENEHGGFSRPIANILVGDKLVSIYVGGN